MKHHPLLFACSTLCILVACTKQTTSSPTPETTALQTTASTVLTTTTSESTTTAVTTQTPESTTALETTVEAKPVIEQMSDEVVAVNREKYAKVFEDFEFLASEESIKNFKHQQNVEFSVDIMARPIRLISYQYTFFDINDDGQEEMLVSLKKDEGPYLVYLFYNATKTVNLLAQTYLGSAGGARISATLLPDKSVLDEHFSSFDGKGDAKILTLKKGTNAVIEQVSLPIVDGQTPYEKLGVEKGNAYDLTTLDWRDFD